MSPLEETDKAELLEDICEGRRYSRRSLSAGEVTLRPIGLSRSTIARPVLLCVAALSVFGVLGHALQFTDLVRALWLPDLSPAALDRDFANYWLAGRMALHGDHMDLFSQPAYFLRLQEVFGVGYPIRAWSYPPHFLLFLWPLGLLPYEAALIAFMAATFAVFCGSVVVFRRTYAPDSAAGVLLLALTPYVVMMFVAAQNGFLTAALLLYGLAAMKRRPALAGMAFAALTIKPQLGLLVPVLLAFDRNWAAVAWSAVLASALILLSVAFFGAESWHAYLTDTLSYQRSVMTDWHGIFLRMMPTVFGSARSFGMSPETAFALQWPVSVLAATLVAWLFWREADPLRRAFVLGTGTFLVSPYAFNYDMGALAVAAALLLGSGRVPGDRFAQLSVGIVAVIPAAVTNLGRAGLPVVPVILAAALVTIVMDVRRRACPTGVLSVP